MTREANPLAAPVIAVKNDHHNTTRVKTLRGPILSPIIPVGISNRAYERAKAPSTQPNCSLVRPRSSLIRFPLTDMHTRSRYTIMERKNKRARTWCRTLIETGKSFLSRAEKYFTQHQLTSFEFHLLYEASVSYISTLLKKSSVGVHVD